ncbi:unnamed protein product [Eruca vesicaria subsp. sativa]|uniref:Neprosin PEP catalytic domain-containing protein n=1 Tax=Eruca vesicaria subsp. sativa TaxID=29727 RepID=A0ABC8LLJ9_ERUVS|nr:unnamed protein product [Eruca vesicaria subsp. sativa]
MDSAAHFSNERVLRVFLALFCFWGLLSLTCAAGRLSVSSQNFEVHKHLKRLNKPAVKSIQLWILGASFGQDLNSIEAGWQVSPDLYGDNNTRLFTYWTSDAYQAAGCYNLLCSGFIQVNSQIAMGASISPVSGFHNPQYDINITIWKDPKEGHWWMQFGDGYVLGYWPSFLFSYLADSASIVEWGGEVVNMEEDGHHTTTEMESGQFPDAGFSKASYFRNIQVVDSSNNLKEPKGLTL